MESYEIPAREPDSLNNLLVNPEIKNYLAEAARWARFIGIVGYVFTGLLVVGSFFVGAFMNFMANRAPATEGPNPFSSGVFSVVMGAYFLVIALIYYFPSRYLHQFGVKTLKALHHHEQISFTQAFSRLKSFFKFFGVFTLVVLVLYGLGLLFLLVFGTMMGNAGQGNI